MASEVIIVPAEPEHIPAAEDIAIAAWTPIREVFRRELGDAIYEAAFDGWQDSKKRAVSTELSSGRGYVSLLDGKVVGFISYRINEKGMGVIGNNAVDPNTRGLGIGTKQYEFVLEKMREEGCKFACVQTGGDDGHAPARRAYEKAGFHRFLPSVMYYQEL